MYFSTSPGKIMELAHVDDVHFFFFSLAVNT